MKLLTMFGGMVSFGAILISIIFVYSFFSLRQFNLEAIISTVGFVFTTVIICLLTYRSYLVDKQPVNII